MDQYHYFISYRVKMLINQGEKNETYSSIIKLGCKIMEEKQLRRLEKEWADKVKSKNKEAIEVKITNINFLGTT